LTTKDPEPTPRSGLTMTVYRDFLVVFGGIYVLTQELNDCYIYDMKNRNWLCLFDEEGTNAEGRSPAASHKAAMGGSMSPAKRRTLNETRDKSMLKDRYD